MLKILLLTSETTLDALDAADNQVDVGLRLDLQRLITRTRLELAALISKT